MSRTAVLTRIRRRSTRTAASASSVLTSGAVRVPASAATHGNLSPVPAPTAYLTSPATANAPVISSRNAPAL